jgi:predicted rRNA methylase
MITSKQNSFIKEIRSLSDKKFRDKLNLYTVEGTKIVKEAIELKLPVKAIVGTERGLNTIESGDFRCELLSEEVFRSISSEVCPQGVIAVIEKPDNIIAPPNGSCVLLDGVADPSNVGAIIRTADAVGAHGIIIPKRRAAALTGVVAKASAGAALHVPVARVPNIPNAIEDLKKRGLWIMGTDLTGETCFYDADFKGAIGVVIGSEGNGMGRLVREKCDYVLTIPMKGKVSSLNASVAAGVVLYEAFKQRNK